MTNNIEWNQPLTPSYLLQCWTPYTTVHNQHSWRWTHRCPKHVELFMIINHNCCIKLVPLVIFIYGARSHIHQITLKMIYYSYFHSVMTYGLLFWGNSPDSIKIFRLPKVIIRIMIGCRNRDSCRKLFFNLEILPLSSQYIFPFFCLW